MKDSIADKVIRELRRSAIHDRFPVRAMCIQSILRELSIPNNEVTRHMLLKKLDKLRRQKRLVIYSRKSKHRVRTYGLPYKQYDRCQNIRQRKVIRNEKRLAS